MRAPDIQFAAPASSVRLLGIVLLVVGIAAIGVSLWQYLAALRNLDRADAQLSSTMRSEENRRSSPAARTPQIPEQKLNAINNAIARLNVPWNELFAALETNKPKDVALLALLPEARKRVLVVQAETVTPRAMIEFVDWLRSMPSFEEAVLVKHERRDQDAEQPYRFAVEVRWKEQF